MAKETLLFTVNAEIRDQDFDDVYRIYLQEERRKDRKIAVITCVVLALICVLVMIIIHNFTFLIYAGACLVAGVLYWVVPVNRKFIAQNKLQFGEKREIGFYPHRITSFEILEDEETLSEEEKAEATSEFSTGNMTAYESERGFLFADGKIANQFVYVPKRKLDEQDAENIREFAKQRCSAGYHLLEMRTMLDGSDGTEEEDENGGDSFVSEVCDQYYGIKKLHLHDDSGKRISDEDEALTGDDAQQEAHTEIMDAPDMDVDAEWEKIISEEEDE